MNASRSMKSNISQFFTEITQNSGVILGVCIAVALLFFEMFNYSTTDFALKDLLGDLKFFGIRWATTLSIAFCVIDFAGIARLFTPEDTEEPKEVWYLFGAWLLAATMNAALTWWGVSMALVNHTVQSTAIVKADTIISIVPLFVAILVWIIRILIIGTISVAGNRIISSSSQNTTYRRSRPQKSRNNNSSLGNTAAASPMRSASSSRSGRITSRSSTTTHPEPTYHTFSGASSDNSSQSTRKF